MKGCFFGFVLGLDVAVGGAWWYLHSHPAKPAWEQARDRIVSDAEYAERATQSKLDALGLTPDNIRDELAHTGTVIRRKGNAVGAALSDVAADTRITADIKAKFVADPDLSAVAISVSTTGGCVTLAGSASSPGDISKAMTLAYDTPGVTQVISTLQVK